MSYCSRSCRRRFTVLDFKSWAYSHIYGHFQQHLYCACAETVIYELCVHPHIDNSHQVWSWYDHTLRSYTADMSRDLVTLTFELLTLNSCHTWRVTWSTLATKFEDSTPIRSWVMSYNVSRWLPLKMRTRPLRMRRTTWPVCRGSKIITILECPTPICLFTVQLLLGYNDD